MQTLICGELFMFWHIMGKHVRSTQYTMHFLELPDCPPSSRATCLALKTAGLAQWTLGHFERAIATATRCYALAESFEDKRSMTVCKFIMFLSNLGLGKMDETLQLAGGRG